MNTVNREDMQRAIERAINRSCGENDSNTPDFILGQYLMDCFDAFTACSVAREKWYGKHLSIEGTPPETAQPKGEGT
jgi:hypothetical protein